MEDDNRQQPLVGDTNDSKAKLAGDRLIIPMRYDAQQLHLIGPRRAIPPGTLAAAFKAVETAQLLQRLGPSKAAADNGKDGGEKSTGGTANVDDGKKQTKKGKKKKMSRKERRQVRKVAAAKGQATKAANKAKQQAEAQLQADKKDKKVGWTSDTKGGLTSSSSEVSDGTSEGTPPTEEKSPTSNILPHLPNGHSMGT